MNCETLKQQLVEAEAALHRLMTGEQEVSIRDGDKQTTYSQIGAAQLRAYIEDLRGKVEACEGRRTTGRRIVYLTPS